MPDPITTPQPSETVLGTARDYAELMQNLVARRKALRLTQLDMDHATGLPDGYCGKLEAHMRSLGGLSFPAVMQALGLKIVIAVDDTITPRRGTSERYTPQNLVHDTGRRQAA